MKSADHMILYLTKTDTEGDNLRNQSKPENKTQSCFRAKTTTLCKTASKREREHYILKFKLSKFRFCDIENEIELETSRFHFPNCNHETDTEYGKTLTSKYG